MTSPSSNIPHAAPRPLWRAMRAFLCLLFDLFGESGDIAAKGVLDRRGRALITPWLVAGEAFLRRLLFIEALALAPDLRAAQAKPRERAPRKRRLMHFYPDKPEEWRVSFRLAPARRVQRTTSASGGKRAKAPPLALPAMLCVPKPRSPPFAARAPQRLERRARNARAIRTTLGQSPSASRRCCAPTTRRSALRCG